MYSRSKLEMDPCLFPALNDGVCLEEQTKQIELELKHLFQTVKAFCIKNQTTTDTFFTAVWSIVLRRYVELDHLFFGVNHDCLRDNTAGISNNDAVIEVGILPGTTIKDLLDDDYYRINQLRPESCHRFNTGVLFTTGESCHQSELTTIPVAPDGDCGDKQLLLLVNLHSTTPSLQLQYHTATLSEPEALLLGATISHVIQCIMEDPLILVKDVSLVSKRHMERISEWNSNATLPPTGPLIHETIHLRTVSDPSALAVCSWDGQLTYGELEIRSSQLAWLLRDHGVGPETLVPLCFEKSLWAIVAVLGVIKAGGAFVPMDPSHPSGRLKGIIAQANATLVVTSHQNAELVAPMVKSIVTVSGSTFSQMSTQDTFKPLPLRETNTAYVLFTSGSTGRPKGCIHDHKSLSAVSHHADALHIQSNSRVLQFASYSFGVSLIEIFCPLTKGATICIPSEHDRLSDLAGALRRIEADWALLTPSALTGISPESTPKLRTLVVGGELLTNKHIMAWTGRVNLLQAYGLTEWAGIFSVHQNVCSTTNPMSIGVAPTAGVWLVDPDSHDRLAPIGAVAELVIGGPCLTQGYLGDADRTAKSFIDCPAWMSQFCPEMRQSRLYKTGDLVRYGPGGAIVYMSRKDTQVKVRGQRVELGEVEEAVLRKLCGARRVIVGQINLESRRNHEILAAFVYCGEHGFDTRTDNGYTLDSQLFHEPDDQFRTDVINVDLILRTSLPSYMLPQIYLPLRYIPLTVSGKVDRRTLREVANRLPSQTLQSYMSPKTDKVLPISGPEKALHALFTDTLGVRSDQFGINDSYFSLGGDSITAMQLIARCRALGIHLTVQNVFHHKTVRNLASLIREDTEHMGADEAQLTPFPLSPGQQLLFHDQGRGLDLYKQSRILELNDRYETQHIRSAMDALVKRHSMLRARFVEDSDGVWTQSILPSNAVETYKLDCQALEPGESSMATSGISVDIKNGPVFSARLFDHHGDRQVLCLVAHSLIVDSLSWEILLQDLESLLCHGVLSSDTRSLSFRSWCQLQSRGSYQPQEHQTPASKKIYARGTDSIQTQGVTSMEEEISINEEMTSDLLGAANIPLRTEPSEILLAALLYTCLQVFHTGLSVKIERERQRRADNSQRFCQEVGLFSELLRVQVADDCPQDAVTILAQSKDAVRRRTGNGYDACHPSCQSSHVTGISGDAAPADLYFRPNIRPTSQWKTIALTEVSRSIADPLSDKLARYASIEVSVSLIDGRATINIAASRQLYTPETLERLAQGYRQSLEQLLQMLRHMQRVFTLSDFPLLTISRGDLDLFVDHGLASVGIASAMELEDAYPCSPTQQGILFSQMRNPGHYQMSIDWRATVAEPTQQPIDVDRLKRAWLKVVDRHSILRTIFMDNMTREASAIQVLLRRGVGRVSENRCVDGDHCIASGRTIDANHKGKETLPRLTITEVQDSNVSCTVEINHALIDATSMMILQRDLVLAYSGKLTPPDNVLQYREYISYLQGIQTDAAREYWQQRLADCEPCLFPRLDAPCTIHNEYLTVDIEFERASAVFGFVEGTGITLANIFHLAWGLVLRAFTGMDTVLFGYITSGRDVDLDGIEDAVGPFINMLICRLDFADDDLVSQVLERAQDDFLRSLSSQQFSLAEALHGVGASGSVLYNTCVTFPPQKPPSGYDEADIQIEEIRRHDPTEFDIVLEGRVGGKRMGLTLRYWTSALSPKQSLDIAKLIEHTIYQIVEVAQGKENIGSIDLIEKQAKEQIMKWNDPAPRSISRCVHHVIRERCLTQPDAPAVHAWDGNMTYKDVGALSSILAVHLSGLGVGPDVFVPVYFEKSVWTTVAILGVIKAGGAFILLDPLHPMQRLQSICRDVSASVIVASTQNAVAAGELAREVVALGQHESAWRQAHSQLDRQTDGDWECSTVGPESSLYAIFTSGSTGTPKGAVVHHAAFTSSALAHGKAMQLISASRVLQFGSYVFDAAILETLTTLTVGGCICVPSDRARQDSLTQVSSQMQITWAELTPSVARTLQPVEIPTLEVLVFVGEAVRASDIQLWTGHVTLLNGYGPTECSVITSVASALSDTDPTNIGFPTGCSCWIVDRNNHHRLMPIGAVGELLIEGAIVGHGYLGDPEKTAAAFIPPPSWLEQFLPGRKHTRLYKSGDLVQYAANGSLRYIGRKDNQVKIRGQRVELGEVEYHVQQCFEPSSAVVVEIMTPLAARAPILVAFIQSERFAVPDTQQAKDSPFFAPSNECGLAAVLAQLQERLPSYMVPAVLIPISFVPLTKTGKTDRRFLREQAACLSRDELERFTRGHQTQKAGPSSEAEGLLHKIWVNVLNVSPHRIGMDDSFFSIGGDSITAMQVSSQCRAAGFSITVADIFEYKSISGLAAILQKHDHAFLKGSEDYDSPFDLSPVQALFFEQQPENVNYFNQSFLVPFTRLLPLEAYAHAIRSIVQQHSMLRARFRQSEDGTWSQFITEELDGSYCFEKHQVPTMSEARSVMSASQESLDIRSGPLFHVNLLEVGDREQYLFLVAHHLVVDLVSWRIILGDLEEHLKTGHGSGAQPLPFQTWCNLQDAFSREHLAPKRALPFDIPSPPHEYWGAITHRNTFGDSVHASFTLDKYITDRLFGTANDAFRTQPVELFHAALLHSFVKTFIDRPPPTIFNEGHGREPWNPAIDLSRTVGWFTTLWPTHVLVGAADTIAESVRRTKDARRQVPSNGWGYFASRYLNPEGRRVFKTSGPVEIAFNYFGLYQQFNQKGANLQPPLRLADGPPDMAPESPRFALIDVLAGVEQSRLEFRFLYNSRMRHQEQIQAWVINCERSLQEAAEHLTITPTTYTLCDFPQLGLTYETLETFVGRTQALIDDPNVELEDAYPCSPIQQGILLSQARDPTSYQTRLLWDIVPTIDSGPIDIFRLQDAWRNVVKRHAVLRTIFVPSTSQDGYLDQVVLSSVSPEITVIQSSSDDPTAALLGHRGPINNHGGPPHRLVLYPTSTGAVHTMLEITHALMDGMSNQILQHELQLAYDNALPPGRGPLYRKYVAYLQSLPREPADTYWQAYLKDIQPCIFPALTSGRHPNDAPRRLRSIAVDLGQNSRLQTFCEQQELTMSNLLAVAWGLVLRSYTGTDDVCFGYLTSGRDMPVEGIQETVGPFIGMLVCRMDLGSETAILPKVQAQRKEYIQSVAHQHYSLSHMLHLAGTSGETLFNTVISLQKGASGSSDTGKDMASIRVKFAGGEDPTEYAIVVNIKSDTHELHVSLSYWTTLLTDSQAASVASTFSQAVNEIVNRPMARVGELKRVSRQDEHQVRIWNSQIPQQLDRCVHSLIQERCRAQPDSPAVCSWDGNFSYKELDQLSTRLAHHLVDIGVDLEVCIPVCLEKSRWTTVAMLAIVKAGGAFVLLDPSYPVQRLQAICRQVSAPMIVTSRLHTAIARELAQGMVVIDDDQPSWMNGSITELPLITPDNTLYIAFTSGSTGTPKGAIAKHGGFCTGADAFTKPYHLTAASRVLQFSSYAFDLSILETLATLLVGGCICVPSEKARQENLAESASSLGVTWAEFTPSVGRTLKPRDIPTLAVVVLIGEKMQEVDVDIWAGDVRLINAYGPTECSIISTVQPTVSKETDPSNIGFPTGCLCWVVDPDDVNTLMPIGAVGELLIDGPIVGDGYINRPDLSSELFIECPSTLSGFRPGLSNRLYKTGDLVQHTVDGSLRFVSRKDKQVKIRGQRVELGEVEHHIQQWIESALDVVADIITPSWGAGAPMLIAFIWSGYDNRFANAVDEEIFLPPNEASRKVAHVAISRMMRELPSYMVPAAFISLAQLPLTKTGKKDRRILCQKAAGLARDELEAYSQDRRAVDVKQMPSSAAERKLQQLWAQVLKIPPDSIGSTDNFFHLGGDSITAIKLMNAARDDGIHLADFFAHPILADQAQALDDISTNSTAIVMPRPFALLRVEDPESFKENLCSSHKLSPDEIVDALPVTRAQEHAITNSHCTYFVWHIAGAINLERLQAACIALVEDHSILRAVFVPYRGQMLQVVLRQTAIPFNRSTAGSQDLATFSKSLCYEDSMKRIPFGVPPLQITLASRDDSDHMLILRLSQAQFDEYCWATLFQGISSAYQGNELSATTSFNVYMQHLLSLQTTRVYAFWEKYLHGSTMTILDHFTLGGDRRAQNTAVMVAHDIPLASPPPGVDMGTIINTAWALVLAGLTSNDDLVFGHIVSGRAIPPELESAIGPCSNTIPIRVTLQHTWAVRDLLIHVQTQLEQTAEFATTDLQTILDRSNTNWAKSTSFGSTVRHNNINMASNPDFSLGGGIRGNLTTWTFAPTSRCISISSVVQEGQLRVELLTSSESANVSSASAVLQQLCDIISKLCRGCGDVPIYRENKLLNIDLQ